MTTQPADEATADLTADGHGDTCDGCLMLAYVTRAETAEAVLTQVREAVSEAQAMDRRGPDQFKTGQDHLPPAFREVNWQSAFMALAKIMTKVEEAVDVTARAEAERRGEPNG